MLRKVFWVLLLVVLFLPVIVLAKDDVPAEPVKKPKEVKASVTPRGGDQDWITLLGSQAREFKADSDRGVLRFPVNLNGVTPEQVSLRLRDVRLGQRGDIGLRDYFVVPGKIAQDPQQGPLIEVVVNLDKDPPQGSYDLLIEASTSTQPHPRNLELKVVHPVAKLKPADKVVLQTTKYPLWEPKLMKPPLTLTETSGNSRLKPLKLVKPVFSGVQGEVSGGGLDFPDFPGQISAGGTLPVKYQITGNFPLGTFTGSAQLSSPQLTEPLTVQFEVKNLMTAWLIIPLLILGLVIGWLSRTYLTLQVELYQARLTGGEVLARLAGQLRRIPDKIFADNLEKPKGELETALMGRDPKAIKDKATDADQKLRDALKDFDDRRARVQAKMDDFTKFFDTNWFLPPQIQGVLTAHRPTLTEAQNKLATRDAEGARVILFGVNQGVSGGLEAGLRTDLMQPVADWKGQAQNALDILSQANLPLPAPLTRSLNAGAPLLNGLLAKVLPVQAQDQMPQILAIVLAVHDVLTGLRSALYQAKIGFDHAGSQCHDILSLVPTVDQAALQNLTDEIAKFSAQFLAALPNPVPAVDMLDGVAVRQVDEHWQKFLKGLAASLPDDAKKAVDDKTAVREYVDAALKFAELSHTERTRDFLKKVRAAAGVSPEATGPLVWLQQTLFPGTAPPLALREELPPALASFLTQTRGQLLWATSLQTLIFGAIIVYAGFAFFQDKFVGTLADMAAVFFWGYSLDVSINTVLGKIKPG